MSDLVKRLRRMADPASTDNEWATISEAAARIEALEAALATAQADMREKCAERWVEERFRLRALLAVCHDHMHELTAIIPGNDRAYERTTDLMGDIREELAGAASKGEGE